MDLKASPYHLSDEQIAWVNETRDNLSLRQKAGQVLCINILEEDVSGLIAQLKALDIEPGGFMTRTFPARTVQNNFRTLQNASALPLLLASNLERGADGVCEEGTLFGTQMQVAAADDEQTAYDFGYVCGTEGMAVGSNWNFGPILDIDYNCFNPITNTRVFSSDPDMVLKMSKACVKGMIDSGIAVCLKHWPGDGRDFRDQHMVATTNDMSTAEWDQTYGMIYREMIAMGAQSVMSAHIMQPAWSRKLVPGIRDEEIMPGSLSYELNHLLLRDRLGFNGLVVSDATTMNGFMQVMPRQLAVPTCIANGCDIFLFTLSLAEDFQYLLDGIKSGILSEERLDNAVTRVLAMKAALGLPEKLAAGIMIPDSSALDIFTAEDNRDKARRCADQAVTLVKDTQKLLPVTPVTHKHVLLHVLGDVGGYHDPTRDHHKYFIDLLAREGFEVTCYDGISGYIETKIEDLKKQYDLILYFANIKTSGSDTTARIRWAGPGALNSTRYIHDIPTLFISVDNPYHLIDVPRVKTLINGYTTNPYVMEAIIEKITGRSEFRGTSPVDPFCGLWDAWL